jgi:hypothetical protein
MPGIGVSPIMAAMPLVHSGEEVGTNWHGVKAIPDGSSESPSRFAMAEKPRRPPIRRSGPQAALEMRRAMADSL